MHINHEDFEKVTDNLSFSIHLSQSIFNLSLWCA